MWSNKGMLKACWRLSAKLRKRENRPMSGDAVIMPSDTSARMKGIRNTWLYIRKRHESVSL